MLSVYRCGPQTAFLFFHFFWERECVCQHVPVCVGLGRDRKGAGLGEGRAGQPFYCNERQGQKQEHQVDFPLANLWYASSQRPLLLLAAPLYQARHQPRRMTCERVSPRYVFASADSRKKRFNDDVRHRATFQSLLGRHVTLGAPRLGAAWLCRLAPQSLPPDCHFFHREKKAMTSASFTGTGRPCARMTSCHSIPDLSLKRAIGIKKQ